MPTSARSLISGSLLSMCLLSGCAATPSQCPPPAIPPADLMQPPPAPGAMQEHLLQILRQGQTSDLI